VLAGCLWRRRRPRACGGFYTRVSGRRARRVRCMALFGRWLFCLPFLRIRGIAGARGQRESSAALDSDFRARAAWRKRGRRVPCRAVPVGIGALPPLAQVVAA
jgi:hypothetical protein